MAYTENLITIQQQVSNHLLLFHLFSYKYFRFLSLLTLFHYLFIINALQAYKK